MMKILKNIFLYTTATLVLNIPIGGLTVVLILGGTHLIVGKQSVPPVMGLIAAILGLIVTIIFVIWLDVRKRRKHGTGLFQQ